MVTMTKRVWRLLKNVQLYTLTMFTHNTTYGQAGTWALENLPPQTTGDLCFGIFDFPIYEIPPDV